MVTAFLMKSKKWSVTEALSSVKAQRPCVSPNQGFMDQLCLFEAMRWRIDKTFLPYKLYKLTQIHQQVSKSKILPAAVKNSLGKKTKTPADNSQCSTPNSETSSESNSFCVSNNGEILVDVFHVNLRLRFLMYF